MNPAEAYFVKNFKGWRMAMGRLLKLDFPVKMTMTQEIIS